MSNSNQQQQQETTQQRTMNSSNDKNQAVPVEEEHKSSLSPDKREREGYPEQQSATAYLAAVCKKCDDSVVGIAHTMRKAWKKKFNEKDGVKRRWMMRKLRTSSGGTHDDVTEEASFQSSNGLFDSNEELFDSSEKLFSSDFLFNEEFNEEAKYELEEGEDEDFVETTKMDYPSLDSLDEGHELVLLSLQLEQLSNDESY